MPRVTLVHEGSSAESNQIFRFLHCGRCLKEKPGDQSPMEWARLNIGMTPKGIQIWCVRHNISVDHIKFTDKPVTQPGLIVKG